MLQERKVKNIEQAAELAEVTNAPQRPRKGKRPTKTEGANIKKAKPKFNTIVLMDRKGRYAKIVWDCDHRGRIKKLPDALFHSSRMIYLAEPKIFLKGAAIGAPDPQFIEQLEVATLQYSKPKTSDVMREAFTKAGAEELVNNRQPVCIGAKSDNFHCFVTE